MLPDLKRLTLQAYHVTDAAFSYFSPRQRSSLESVRLTQCMDVTNQGLINLAFALPSLVVLSVNGCTNLTDDGLEVICENLKHLRALDLAWCAKVTDSGMESVASCLSLLQKLILDR
ncbi:F-box and leucine-rich repeat protein 16 [Fasciola gigantica]|uniref:F-box and leucine-rich repeat protein 16 n=1 Tax=Fasciola gigantica TaxID=46835 RepID=A0A504YZA4_FASGI|nr:F-box and leucine-rich repeat protein 16 [Fasciola gigantica]